MGPDKLKYSVLIGAAGLVAISLFILNPSTTDATQLLPTPTPRPEQRFKPRRLIPCIITDENGIRRVEYRLNRSCPNGQFGDIVLSNPLTLPPLPYSGYSNHMI